MRYMKTSFLLVSCTRPAVSKLVHYGYDFPEIACAEVLILEVSYLGDVFGVAVLLEEGVVLLFGFLFKAEKCRYAIVDNGINMGKVDLLAFILSLAKTLVLCDIIHPSVVFLAPGNLQDTVCQVNRIHSRSAKGICGVVVFLDEIGHRLLVHFGRAVIGDDQLGCPHLVVVVDLDGEAVEICTILDRLFLFILRP